MKTEKEVEIGDVVRVTRKGDTRENQVGTVSAVTVVGGHTDLVVTFVEFRETRAVYRLGDLEPMRDEDVT